MTDDRKPPRAQTQPRVNRDDYVEKHEAVPAEMPHEITGQYAGEELRAIRSRRPTDERIERLEDKHDALHEIVTETRVAVGEMRGEIKGEFQTLREMRAREQLVFKQTTEVGTAEALAEIDEKTHGVKTRREWVTQALKIFAGIAALAGTAYAAGRCG